MSELVRKKFELPEVVNSINKDKKAIKITTLTRAKALRLKRFFSGSFFIDDLTGGGYAYKRVHLLFGAKSSGKNAGLNQMMAYNQRLCRVCHGIRPDIPTDRSADRWTVVLRDILQIPVCQCKDNLFMPKKFYILDYEKTMSYEPAKIITLQKFMDTRNDGLEIDGLDYNGKVSGLSELKKLEKLNDTQKQSIKETEAWLKHIKIVETTMEQLSTIDYLEKCGLFIDELLISDPEDTEEGTEYMREVIRSLEVDGIILDSLQAMLPKYVKERDADEATMGSEPKANALMLRHVCSTYAADDLEDEKWSYLPPLFITSQVRSSLSYGAKAPTYSGGHAVGHLSSLILENKRIEFLREDGSKCPFDQKFFGQKVRLRTEKTKISAPAEMCEIDYYFRDGENYKTGEIDHIGEIVELGVRKKIIERAGAWYRTKGLKFNGMKDLKKYFRDNSTFVGDLYKEIKIR